MPSPDVSQYVDLTLFDASSQTIYTNAIEYAQVALPELVVREGSIEAVVLQSMALEVQEAIYAINRLPGAITEVLLRMLDLEHLTGERTSGVARFVGTTTGSFVIPVGTRLFYQEDSQSDPLVLTTVSEVTAAHTRSISSISRTGTAVTVATNTRHGLSVGDVVSITGTTTLDEASRTILTVPSLSTFTYTSAVSGSASATTGTVTPVLTIPARGVVDVQATTIGSSFNGLSTGTQLSLLSVVPSVASVTLAQALSGGEDAETDTQYFNRGMTTLSRLSTSLATAAQTSSFVLDGRFPSAYRCTAIDNANNTRNTNLAGNVLIVVAPIDSSPTELLSGNGDGSLNPTDVGYGTLDEINDAVSERSHASLDVDVASPAFVTVGVQATVKRNAGATPFDVENTCETYLGSYLSTNNWDWSTTIRVNEIVNGLGSTSVEVGTSTVPAVDYVSSVTLTPTDVSVPSTSTTNRFSISSISRTTNVVTVTTTAAHGVSIGVGETLYLKVSGVTDTSFNTSGVVTAASASGSQFTFNQTAGNATSSGGVVVALVKKLSNGDLQILDPAPLVISSTHAVTVV